LTFNLIENLIKSVEFVVDTGVMTRSLYDPCKRVVSDVTLEITKETSLKRAYFFSKNGKCFRLYTEDYFISKMQKNTLPELLRVNLALSILRLKSLGITQDLTQLKLLDLPSIFFLSLSFSN